MACVCGTQKFVGTCFSLHLCQTKFYLILLACFFFEAENVDAVVRELVRLSVNLSTSYS